MKNYTVYYVLSKDCKLFWKQYDTPHTFKEMRAYNRKLEKSLFDNIQCIGAYSDPAAFMNDYNTMSENAIQL